jgi:hypothetical protein
MLIEFAKPIFMKYLTNSTSTIFPTNRSMPIKKPPEIHQMAF